MGFGEEFAVDRFAVRHHEPRKFVESQIGGRSLTYLVYRGAVPLIFMAIIIYDWSTYDYGYKWWIFLTNWTVVWITLTSLVMWINAHRHYTKANDASTLDCLPCSYQMQWMMYTILCLICPMVTLLYWGFVYTPTTAITFVNVAKHVFNTVWLIVDLFIVAMPIFLLHLYLPIIFALTYVAFTFIYWQAGGTGETEPYIYSVLNYPENLGRAIFFLALVVFVVGPMIYFCMYILHKLREAFHRMCCLMQSGGPPDETSRLKEVTTEK